MEGEDYNALEKLQLNDAALVFEPESSQASSPADLPDPGAIEEIREPWMRIQVFTPVGHLENLNGLWLSSHLLSQFCQGGFMANNPPGVTIQSIR